MRFRAGLFLILALAACGNIPLQPVGAQIPISQWPVPPTGSVDVSNGDAFVGTRGGVSYKLIDNRGGTCATNQWVNQESAQGVPACAQPGFSNLSGFISPSQFPATAIFTALTLNNNSGALPLKQTGTLLQVGNANATATRLEADGFGAAGYFTAMREDGTAASPTTLQSGDEIGGYNAFGYNGTAIVGPRASFRTFAAENWTTGANGTYADIAITPTGGTTLTEKVFVGTAGVGLGTNTPLQALDVRGLATENGAIANGTTFSVASGCGTTTSVVGGVTAGSFVAGATTCNPVINLPTAPHGWKCSWTDITTPADSIKQSAYSTTSCTGTGTVVSSDVILFSAERGF